MISEISSLLSQADASLARSGGHKFSANMNRNRIRSISAYSSNSIFYFATIVSDQATPEEVTMTSRFLEKSYASFVVACIGLMPFHRIKADDQASIEEYLSQFHQNLGVHNGNGAAISKAMNVASRLAENSTDLVGLNQSLIESVRAGVSDEDIATTQDFLQECWDRSRATCTDYINVVNESIVSLNDKFSKDAIDPVTRTLQEAYKATLHELDTWGFLGEASTDMNLWDDMESLSDDELAAVMNPYDGSTIDDLDDEDIEDEYPELDAMLETSWEDLYKKAKETMSNSDAVAYANEQFAKIKEKASQAKEVAVQKTKDLGDRIKNGAPKVMKSEAEKLDDKAKDAIDKQIIREGYADENSGALDRQNQQIKADQNRHRAEEAAARRTAAADRRTAVEAQKAATAEAKEQRKQQELQLAMQAQQEAAGSAMLKAKLDAAKLKLQQARDNNESRERVSAAQAAVNDQLEQNQEALAQQKPEPTRSEPKSPIQIAAKKAKDDANKALEAAEPVTKAPSQQQVAYNGQPVANEAATMGQAVESIKYSLQSVSAEKINGCKSISQLNKLDAKLKTLRSRYTSYLNRYKRKAQQEEKKGNSVAAKLHNATIGDPKAFMLQYGNYIREINARIEMIRRRKKALAPDIGKPVDESQFATITDMDLQAIDYCISEASKMVDAPDEEVFDIIVDENFLTSAITGKSHKVEKSAKPSLAEPKTVSQPSYSSVDPAILHRAIKNMGIRNEDNSDAIDEASFAAKHEIKQSQEYKRLMELKSQYKKTKNTEDRIAMLEEAVDLAGKIKVYAYHNIPRDNPAEWVAHTFAEQFRHPLLILINLANALSGSDNRYRLIQFTKYATRNSFVGRLEELESDLRTALRKVKNEGKRSNRLFDESVANRLIDDAVLLDEAGTQSTNKKNDDTEFIGNIKKATGAVKDVYDIIDNERKNMAERDKMRFGKDPKKSDPKDLPLYYQNNRQRSGINVAAAANAQEIKGYEGHKVFDKEVFTNMDMKKANEAIPTFAKATIGFIVDETEQVVSRDVLVGVKVWIHRATSMDLISDIYNSIINKRKFLQFVKWISGESVSLADLMFGIKELKLDANSTSKPGIGRWLPAFRRRKRLSKMAIPFLMKNYTPNGTVVITMNEVNFIKSEYGVDIMRPDHVKMLMEQSFLLGFVVLDQSNEIVHVCYDGSDTFQQYTYAALERSDGQQSDRAIRELYRSLSRN